MENENKISAFLNVSTLACVVIGGIIEYLTAKILDKLGQNFSPMVDILLYTLPVLLIYFISKKFIDFRKSDLAEFNSMKSDFDETKNDLAIYKVALSILINEQKNFGTSFGSPSKLEMFEKDFKTAAFMADLKGVDTSEKQKIINKFINDVNTVNQQKEIK